jgi:hypothetical protein
MADHEAGGKAGSAFQIPFVARDFGMTNHFASMRQEVYLLQVWAEAHSFEVTYHLASLWQVVKLHRVWAEACYFGVTAIRVHDFELT